MTHLPKRKNSTVRMTFLVNKDRAEAALGQYSELTVHRDFFDSKMYRFKSGSLRELCLTFANPFATLKAHGTRQRHWIEQP